METEIYYKNELGAVSALFASDTDQNRHTENTVLNIFFISHTNNFLMSIFFLSFMKKKENEFQDPMMCCGVYYNRQYQSAYRLQRRRTRSSSGDKTRQQIRYQNERENQLAQ